MADPRRGLAIEGERWVHHHRVEASGEGLGELLDGGVDHGDAGVTVECLGAGGVGFDRGHLQGGVARQDRAHERAVTGGGLQNAGPGGELGDQGVALDDLGGQLKRGGEDLAGGYRRVGVRASGSSWSARCAWTRNTQRAGVAVSGLGACADRAAAMALTPPLWSAALIGATQLL